MSRVGMSRAVLAGDHDADCLTELLHHGAEVDAADAHGVTALHASAALNLPHVASLLLRAGAAADVRGAHGVQPLQLAVSAARAARGFAK